MLGGVPQVVLADRMGCLKAGVVANVVVPTAGLCPLRHPLRVSARISATARIRSPRAWWRHLVGYAKTDLMIPQQPFGDRWTANDAAEVWCAEVNADTHSEICAVPHGAAADRAGAAAAVAVAAARDRVEGDLPEGRQAVLHPVRLGPLLGAVPADRTAGHHHHRQPPC